MPASVLVVDDEYGVRTGVRQILELEGYEVVEAENGRKAIEALDARAFDIVFIDYRLPDLDGLTLLAPIRARDASTMTCMITAYANIDTAVAATRQGVDFFLPKPFTPEDLIGVTETLARHKHAREKADRLQREHERSLGDLASEKSQTRSLVSSLRDAVLVVNRDGEVVLVNHAMAAFIGQPAADLLHVRIEGLLATEPLSRVEDLLRPEAPERAVRELEKGDRSFMASATVFQSESGEVLGRILTIVDTTELRRMALEKSRFIRTMVHEFRSPLGAIKSVLEVVLDESLGSEVSAYAPLLQRAIARLDGLAELINDLLGLSRIDLGDKPAVPPAGSDVAQAIAAAVDVHKPRMDLRNLELSVTLAPELPCASIDSDELRTILVNLVGNATKYNREGGRLSIRAGSEAGMIVLDVEDTGIGIGAANRGRLFDEFYREKRPETRDIEGNGLGLAIVKRLVDRAGGQIAVASTEGKGSVFTVRLPATVAGARQGAPPSGSVSASGSVQPSESSPPDAQAGCGQISPPGT